MKAIAKAFTTKREYSVQEAVEKVDNFPKVMFLNNNLPECRYRIFCKKEELDELTDDSTDIF